MTGKVDMEPRSTMSGELTSADREAITGAGRSVKVAGYCILGGLVVLAVAEIVGHRNMSFKKGAPLGSSGFNKYK